MIQTIRVKEVEIGTGSPKICVPVQGKTKEEIIEQIAKIKEIHCDLIEWRSDAFETIQTDLEEILDIFQNQLGQKPLIFTYRTLKEGGFGQEKDKEYRQFAIRAVQTGKIDLLDVEYSQSERQTKELVEIAHTSGVKTIISSHDFQKTPKVTDMMKQMCHMQDTGADLIKLAVMPHSKEDVLNLLSATEQMNRLYAKRPLTTMSMSEEGVISRYCGGLFGSSITFAQGIQSSAPGQPKVEDLQQVFPIFYKRS